MVSLVNFKLVNDDLNQQQQRLTITCSTAAATTTTTATTTSTSTSTTTSDHRTDNYNRESNCNRKQAHNQNEFIHKSNIVDDRTQQETNIDTSIQDNSNINRMQNLKLVVCNPNSNSNNSSNSNSNSNNNNNNNCNQNDCDSRTTSELHSADSVKSANGMFCPVPLNVFSPDKSAAQSQIVACSPASCETTNFVVTWRNLRFAIEPKWHQRLSDVSSLKNTFKSQNRTTKTPETRTTVAAIDFPGLNSTVQNDSTNNDIHDSNEAHNKVSNDIQPEIKVVLDLLDGSFKSGELTAILGPSGAGKTTLLDCLTGHRKHGLSGSIRISSNSSSSSAAAAAASCKCCSCYCCPPPATLTEKSNNLKHQSSYNNHHDVNQQHRSFVHSTKTSYSKQKQQQHQHQFIHQHPPPPDSSSSRIPNFVRRHQQQQHQQQQQQHHYQQQHQSNVGNGDNLKVSIIPQNDHLMGHLTVYETLNYASKMKNCFDRQFDHKLNIKRVAQQLGLMSCLGTRINKLSGGQYKRVSIAQELLSSPDILILDEPTSGLDAMTCYQTVQVLRKLTDDRKTSGQNPIAVILTIHQPNSDVFQQFNHVYVVAQGGKCIYEGPPSSIESVINRVGIRLPNSYYNPATMIVEIAAGKFGTNAILELNDIQKKQYDIVPVSDEQTSTGDSAVDCPSSSSSTSPSTASNDEDDCDDYKKSNKSIVAAEINNNNNNNNSSSSGNGLINEGFVMDNDESNNNDQSKETTTIVIVRKDGDIGEDSMGRLKNSDHPGGEVDNRRRKRRRTRKRSGDPTVGNQQLDSTGRPIVCSSFSTMVNVGPGVNASGGAGGHGGGGGGGGEGNGNGNGPHGGGSSSSSRGEKRLKLNSLKADQKFPFWRHTYLHFHRSWLSIVRDPMLCSMQLALHIIVPVMVSLVYGTNVGKPNACPRAGPMDIMAYALEPTDSALQLQEDLRTTLENIGYIFFKLYGIIFAAMTVTVLTFPLDMHVLVKEFRNGWYGLSSYFLGRTLADIPFQLTLPLLAMSLSYYATGQPYSYFQWRFLSITGILILSSLIAQSQGLLFGAILMDRMKAAVFVAPAATTPIILFAGFLVRTQSIPHYLRPLSNLSYLRYAIEACLISRYGFNQCECDPTVFNQTVPELPPIARSMLDYWLSSFKTNQAELSSSSSSNSMNLTSTETTTIANEQTTNPDLFTKLLDSLGKANSFGRNITSCEQVVPYPMIDYDLKDSQLFNCFAILIFMLVFTRLLTFFIVCFKVKRKV